MDIYYMHCNQMEAAHPSSGAVMLVTNVSHKGSSPPPSHILLPLTPPLHLAAAVAVCCVQAGGLYIPEESTVRGFAQLPHWHAQLSGLKPRGPVCKCFFACSTPCERGGKKKPGVFVRSSCCGCSGWCGRSEKGTGAKEGIGPGSSGRY